MGVDFVVVDLMEVDFVVVDFVVVDLMEVDFMGVDFVGMNLANIMHTWCILQQLLYSCSVCIYFTQIAIFP